MSIELTITAGPDEGRSAVFERFPVLIGRQPDCDLALVDPSVSRRHAQIGMEGTAFFVADCGSSFGTYLNGEQIQHRVLRDGANVRVGDTEIHIHLIVDEPESTGEDSTLVVPASEVVEVPPIESSDLEFLVHLPDGTSRTFAFRQEWADFGRLEDCDCPIDDPQMSKRHFRVRRLPHQFVVEDLGSRNGTMVDDERRDYWELLPGTRITAGQTRFLVRFVPRSDPATRVEESNRLLTIQDSGEKWDYRATLHSTSVVWYESVGPQPPIRELLSFLAQYRPMHLLVDGQAAEQYEALLPDSSETLCNWLEPAVAKKLPIFIPGNSAVASLAVVDALMESDGWIAYFSDLSTADLLARLREMARGSDESPDGLDEAGPPPPALAKPSLFSAYAAHGDESFCEQILGFAKAVLMESPEAGGWQALSGSKFRQPLGHAGFRAVGAPTGEFKIPTGEGARRSEK